MQERILNETRHLDIRNEFKNIVDNMYKVCKGNWEFPYGVDFDFQHGWAYAWFSKEYNKVYFNTKFDYSETKTLVHELTHHICYVSGIDKEEGKGFHHLEFAIIYGVLLKYIKKKIKH